MTKPLPEVLHKIMPAKYGSDVLPFLSNGLIRFTQPGAMNDPLETRSFVDATDLDAYKKFVDSWFDAERMKLRRSSISRKELDRRELPLHAAREALLRDFAANPRKIVDEHWDEIYMSRDKHIGILSLTENDLSSAMWSHYAFRHTGVAVGLDARKLANLYRYGNSFSRLEPVEYSNEVSRMIMTFKSDDLPHNHFFRKSKDWEYEREWRIVARIDGLYNNTDNKKTTTDPIGYPVILVHLGCDLVKEIRIGMFATQETEQRVLEYRNSSRRPIKVFRMKQSSTRFGLEAVPL